VCRKIVTTTSGPSSKIYIQLWIFSSKLYVHEMFGSREFRTIFRAVPKSILDLLQYTENHITGACDIIDERYSILFTTQRKRAVSIANLADFPRIWACFFCGIAVFLKTCGLLAFGLVLIELCLFFGPFFADFSFADCFFSKFDGTVAVSIQW